MSAKTIGTTVMLLALVCLVIGGIFIWQSFSVRGQISDGLLDEQITTAIPQAASGVPGDEDYEPADEGYDPNNKYVNTAAEAQAAHDLILEHMREDPGRYGDTERDSEERAYYVDGITLRNALLIAVSSYGVSTIALASGAVMVVTAVALGGISLVLRRQE